MSDHKHIENVYDIAAENYSRKFFDELRHKPLDRILLLAFAEKNKNEKIIDLGCGPGQTTRFLFEAGSKNIIGTDLSSEMINTASTLNPGIFFERANMLSLPYKDSEFSAALAFYSIVHFSDEELLNAFIEIRRILNIGSDLLLSFHIGENTIRSEDFLGTNHSLDFRFFNTSHVVHLLKKSRFKMESILERWHYESEYPSRRAYVWCFAV